MATSTIKSSYPNQSTRLASINSGSVIISDDIGVYDELVLTIEDVSRYSILYIQAFPKALLAGVQILYCNAANETARAYFYTSSRTFTADSMPNSNWYCRLYGIKR